MTAENVPTPFNKSPDDKELSNGSEQMPDRNPRRAFYSSVKTTKHGIETAKEINSRRMYLMLITHNKG